MVQADLESNESARGPQDIYCIDAKIRISENLARLGRYQESME